MKKIRRRVVLGALLGSLIVVCGCRPRPATHDWAHVREDLKQVGVAVPMVGKILVYEHHEGLRGGDVLLRLRATARELDSLLIALPLRTEETRPCSTSAIQVQQGDPVDWKIPSTGSDMRCAYGGFTTRGEEWGVTVLSLTRDGAVDVFIQMDWDIDEREP